MPDPESRLDRQVRRALRFRQCHDCEYDFATGEGTRACHYYACPYLPAELDVVCPDCSYNVLTNDGAPACGDPATCSFALEEAPAHIETLRRWAELQAV